MFPHVQTLTYSHPYDFRFFSSSSKDAAVSSRSETSCWPELHGAILGAIHDIPTLSQHFILTCIPTAKDSLIPGDVRILFEIKSRQRVVSRPSILKTTVREYAHRRKGSSVVRKYASSLAIDANITHFAPVHQDEGGAPER